MTSKSSDFVASSTTGPGIIYITSRITDPSLPLNILNTWYEIHIASLLATGLITSIARFKNIDSDVDFPHLAIYVLPNLSASQSPDFLSILNSHETSTVRGGVEFDTRYYRLIQRFEPGAQDRIGNGTEWNPALITAGVEPAEGQDNDLDRWYREEHLLQATTQKGFRRSTRYNLVAEEGDGKVKRKDEDGEEVVPKWLALHEWEAGFLGKEVLPFEPMSAWTRRVMENARKIQAGNWELEGSWKREQV